MEELSRNYKESVESKDYTEEYRQIFVTLEHLLVAHKKDFIQGQPVAVDIKYDNHIVEISRIYQEVQEGHSITDVIVDKDRNLLLNIYIEQGVNNVIRKKVIHIEPENLDIKPLIDEINQALNSEGAILRSADTEIMKKNGMFISRPAK